MGWFQEKQQKREKRWGITTMFGVVIFVAPHVFVWISYLDISWYINYLCRQLCYGKQSWWKHLVVNLPVSCCNPYPFCPIFVTQSHLQHLRMGQNGQNPGILKQNSWYINPWPPSFAFQGLISLIIESNWSTLPSDKDNLLDRTVCCSSWWVHIKSKWQQWSKRLYSTRFNYNRSYDLINQTMSKLVD